MQAMERRAKLDVHALWLLQPADYLLVLACRSWSTMPSLMCMHMFCQLCGMQAMERRTV